MKEFDNTEFRKQQVQELDKWAEEEKGIKATVIQKISIKMKMKQLVYYGRL